MFNSIREHLWKNESAILSASLYYLEVIVTQSQDGIKDKDWIRCNLRCVMLLLEV